jgi:thiamine-phosphate pyrophosphorylase
LRLDKKSLLLYAVTDQSWVGRQTLEEQVEETIKAGTTFIQLREKDLTAESFLEEAYKIKKIAKSYEVPFVINDSVEIAIACDADGVHVGQDDVTLLEVRKILGPNKIIGVSVQTVEQAMLAQKQGADYLGVGAVFNTLTKLDAAEVSLETLKEICKKVSIPVVAIGGISLDNICRLEGLGIDGIAVVSAIFASENITSATQKLLKEVKGVVNDIR